MLFLDRRYGLAYDQTDRSGVDAIGHESWFSLLQSGERVVKADRRILSRQRVGNTIPPTVAKLVLANQLTA